MLIEKALPIYRYCFGDVSGNKHIFALVNFLYNLNCHSQSLGKSSAVGKALVSRKITWYVLPRAHTTCQIIHLWTGRPAVTIKVSALVKAGIPSIRELETWTWSANVKNQTNNFLLYVFHIGVSATWKWNAN